MKEYDTNDVELRIKEKGLIDISEFPGHLHKIIYDYFRKHFLLDGINKRYDENKKKILFSEHAVNMFVNYYKQRIEIYLTIKKYKRLNFLTVSEASKMLVDEYGLYYSNLASLRGNIIGYCETDKLEVIRADYHNKQGTLILLSQESFLQYKEYYLKRKELMDNSANYYTLQDVRKILHLSKSSLLKYEKTQKLISFWSNGVEKYYEKSSVDKIVELRNSTITVEELSKEIGKSRTYIGSLADKKIISYCNDGLINEYRVYKSDVNKIKDIISKEKELDEAETQFQKYKLSIEGIESTRYSLERTKALLNKFALERLRETKNKYGFSDMTKLFKLVIMNINNEITMLGNKEIMQLINKAPNKDLGEKLVFFLNFCMSEVKVSFNLNLIFKRKVKEEEMYDSEKDIYTKEQWKKINELLTDIENKSLIEKALNNRTLATTWLYMVLNLCVVWRRSTFIDVLECPLLSQTIGIKDEEFLDWLRSGNYFSLEMGQKIINEIIKKFNSFRMTANKNGGKLKFIIPLNLVRVVGLLLAISQSHKVLCKNKKLLSKNVDDRKNHIRLFGDRYVHILGNETFGNRKANNSVLTFIENLANEKEIGEGLFYGSILRGHSKGKNFLPKSTDIYIRHTNKDGDIGRMCYNLFRSGTFGFIPRILLELAFGDTFTNLSMDEKAEQIASLRKEYSLLNIEGMTFFQLQQKEEVKEIIYELINSPKDRILDLINKICLGSMPGKMEFSQCLKKGLTNSKCAFPAKKNCLGCKYLIPQIYFLIEFNNQLAKIIGRLEASIDINDYIRYSHAIIEAYLPILEQANQVFNEYDPNYLSTFIDIDFLKGKLLELMYKGKLIMSNTDKTTGEVKL